MKSSRSAAVRWIIFALLVCLAGVCDAQDNQKPLGDVVRQNKPAAKARRVITNDEIPSAPTSEVTPPSSPSGDTGKKPAGEDAAAKSDKSKGSKTEPAAKDKEKQDRIEALKKDQSSLLSIQKQMQERLANETVDSRKAIWMEVLQSTKTRLDDNQKELDQLQKPGASSDTAKPNPKPETPQ